MFNFFKKENKDKVGFASWETDPGPGFRLIQNDSSHQYVREDENIFIYFAVILIKDGASVDAQPLALEKNADGTWNLKGTKTTPGQVLACVITVKEEKDVEWGRKYFETVMYKYY